MKANLVIFVVSMFFVNGISFKYGEKKRFDRPRCDEFNPPTLKNVNFNDIVGKYYSVRVKPPCKRTNGPFLSGTVEWVCGQNAAIRSFRLKNNPSFCVTVLSEFKPMYDSDGSKFSMFIEEDNLTIEWRLMHFDSEYIVTWGCYRKDKYERCVDWASGLLRKTRDNDISYEDMQRLDRIVREKTCKTVTDLYEKQELQEDCRDWAIPSKKTYTAKCY